MSVHIAAIAASGIAAEAEALANRQADMSARERHETRLVILVSVIVIAGLTVYAITHIVQ